MRFCFTYEFFLTLEMYFDQQDYDDFISSYQLFGSQLLPRDKIRLWNHRKAEIIHDIVSTYPMMSFIEYKDNIPKMYIVVNDRGEVTEFKTNPNRHCNHFIACQKNLVCQIEEFVANTRMDLCELCGIFYVNVHMCK